MVPAVLVTMNEAPSLGIASIEIVNRKGIRNTAGGSIPPEGAVAQRRSGVATCAVVVWNQRP